MALELPPTPLANEYQPDSAPQEVFPLNLVICFGCSHVQLSHVVSSERMFRNYRYVSGVGSTMVNHFKAAAAELIPGLGLKPGDLVVSIGSNDGTELRPYRDAGMTVLGIDPATKIAEEATASGITTWPEFFNTTVANNVLKTYGLAKLVLANNVFVHTPNPGLIMDGVKQLLAVDGMFVFEVQYLGDLVDKALCDMIYHEHDSYGSIGPFVSFFNKRGMSLTDFVPIGTHGGSIRCFVKNSVGKEAPGVIGRAIEEVDPGALDALATYKALGERWFAIGKRLKKTLNDIRWADLNGGGAGEIYVYGCPAKLTTLMYSFGIGSAEIAAVIDDSPWKQGLYTPGLHIPIVGPEILKKKPPCAVLIGAWNMATAILERLRAQGYAGKIITPLPEVTIDVPGRNRIHC